MRPAYTVAIVLLLIFLLAAAYCIFWACILQREIAWYGANIGPRSGRSGGTATEAGA